MIVVVLKGSSVDKCLIIKGAKFPCQDELKIFKKLYI